MLVAFDSSYRLADFFFPRVQSLESRDLPWESRIKPMRSWLEIGLYGFVVATVGVATLAFV